MEKFTMNLNELKKEVYESNLKIVKEKLVVLTWGNTSAIDRNKGIFAIKPSGVRYSDLHWSNIVLIDLSGQIVDSKLRPSSDTATHLELYKGFQEINAIVHTHSTWATTWAQSGKNIPILGTTHADHFFGDIPCIPLLETKEVQTNYEQNTGLKIVSYFNVGGINPTRMPCCILKSHGPFVWGVGTEEAVNNSIALEYCAKMAYNTLVLNPNVDFPNYILEKHFYRKHGENSYYGNKKSI